MDDKWDVFLFEGKLYFSRSWTGDLALEATLGSDSKALTISAVDARTDAANPNLPIMAIRDVDFLVKTLVFGREVPHSLPPELPSLESVIMTYSFSVFGRAAAFASFGDTTQVSV